MKIATKTKSYLLKELSGLGFTSIDDVALMKCVCLQEKFGILSADAFINSLHAFFLCEFRKTAESTADASLLQLLDAFETHLSHAKSSHADRRTETDKSSAAARPAYVSPSFSLLEDEILDSYCSSTTKSRIKAQLQEQLLKSQVSACLYSPKAAAEAERDQDAFQARADKLSIQVAFGSVESDANEEGWVPFDAVHTCDSCESSDDRKRRFRNSPLQLCGVLNERIERGEMLLASQLGLESDAWAHPLQNSSEELWLCGMIFIDEDALQAAKTFFLQTSRQSGAGCRIALDFSDLTSYALFSGQVIAVRGKNLSGKAILVLELHTPNITLPSNNRRLTEAQSAVFGRLFVAAGPLTCDGSLDFQPLDEFLAVVASAALSSAVCRIAVVLCGPFLDDANGVVANGELLKFPDDVVWELVFLKRLFPFIALQKNVTLFVVPSPRDAATLGNMACFPQPSMLQDAAAAEIPERIVFCPNPVRLAFEAAQENVFSCLISNADVLLALSAEEAVKNPKDSLDRMSRLCSYLVQQNSLFPVLQLNAALNTLPLEFEGFDVRCQLFHDSLPDVVIIPSQLRFFVKKLPDFPSVFVNPAQLCRGKTGGVFSEVCFEQLANGTKNQSIKIIKI